MSLCKLVRSDGRPKPSRFVLSGKAFCVCMETIWSCLSAPFVLTEGNAGASGFDAPASARGRAVARPTDVDWVASSDSPAVVSGVVARLRRSITDSTGDIRPFEPERGM